MQSVGFLKSFVLYFLDSEFRKVNLHVRVGEYVSNSRADCIHECHQGFELGV